MMGYIGPINKPMNDTATAFSKREGTAHIVTSRLCQGGQPGRFQIERLDVRDSKCAICENGPSFSQLGALSVMS